MDLPVHYDIYSESNSQTSTATYQVAAGFLTGNTGKLVITDSLASPINNEGMSKPSLSTESILIQVSSSYGKVQLTELENKAMDMAFKNSVERVSRGRLINS